MKKLKRKHWVIGIVLVVVLLLAGLVGLVYWKIDRITQSIADSAKRANSQNTPLSD